MHLLFADCSGILLEKLTFTDVVAQIAVNKSRGSVHQIVSEVCFDPKRRAFPGKVYCPKKELGVSAVDAADNRQISGCQGNSHCACDCMERFLG